jgi:hypothetical protein
MLTPFRANAGEYSATQRQAKQTVIEHGRENVQSFITVTAKIRPTQSSLGITLSTMEISDRLISFHERYATSVCYNRNASNTANKDFMQHTTLKNTLDDKILGADDALLTPHRQHC